MTKQFLVMGVVIALGSVIASAQQPPAKPMSPEGSAAVQVLGTWTKGPQPAFTLPPS